MSYTIIDRTLNGKKSSGIRGKFLKRLKGTIKEQVKKHVVDGNVTDLVGSSKKKITIPSKNLKQPKFSHGEGGRKEYVVPGNKEYSPGDRIPRPKKGGGDGSGKKASKDGEATDEFAFELSHDEYLDMFFEDCELPDLQNTTITKTDNFETRRAGFTTDGPSSMLNTIQTMRRSKGRRIGLKRKKKKQLLEVLLLQMEKLTALLEANPDDKDLKLEYDELNKEILALHRKLKAVPFLDDTDLRFNRWEKVPVPTSQAVMVNIMDVSASMGKWEKEMAKRFFMLLYFFLTRNYKRVDLVWIRHHTRATIVSEDEFFKGRESGGTLVSTGIEKMDEVIRQKYSPEEWNIYGCQASDGDNWSEDTHLVTDMLERKILPIVRYYAYIEIDKSGRDNELWREYDKTLSKKFKQFQMKKVQDVSNIYPVFQELFRKKVHG